jgi:hypothetical protein
MGGGLFQLNVKGIQDQKLISGDILLNFFKLKYQKYVDFSIEQTKIEPKELVNFGKKFTITFKNTADLLHKLYFCFSLPALTNTSGTYAGWTNSIGHVLIKDVEISTGGITLCKFYGLFLEIWNELTVKDYAQDKMIGKFRHIPLLQTNAERTTFYAVPLPFWFCNNISQSFPLIKMYHSELKISFSLRPFSECVVYDGVTPPTEVSILESYILAEYVYLDEPERTRLRNDPGEYLITQCQTVDAQNVPTFGMSNMDVSFNHPVFELFFVLRETQSEENNDWFNFSIRNGVVNTPIEELITSARLLLDGTTERTKEFNTSIINVLNSSRFHSNTTDKHIYTMAFCDDPENWTQPSGSLNFSVIDHAILQLKLNETIPTSYFHVFALNWNWIQIRDGIMFLDFIS